MPSLCFQSGHICSANRPAGLQSGAHSYPAPVPSSPAGAGVACLFHPLCAAASSAAETFSYKYSLREAWREMTAHPTVGMHTRGWRDYVIHGSNVSYYPWYANDDVSEQQDVSAARTGDQLPAARPRKADSHLITSAPGGKRSQFQGTHTGFFYWVLSSRYQLHGRNFIRCWLKGDDVEWSELPTCERKADLILL